MTRRSPAISLLAALALVASACSDSNQQPEPSPSATPGATTTSPAPPAEIVWSDCNDGIECATLEVPLDYARADNGEAIVLALARRPAEDERARIGAVLVNPGGPGASGVDLARDADLYFPAEILERFDIVGFDPRGVGASEPVDCGDNFDAFFALDPTPDDDAEHRAIVDASRAYAAECERRSGRILPFVDTRSAARDMDRIRAALGEERLTYFGFSYGTYLGATYAELFPDRVRALVLDGAVDPSLGFEELVESQALGFEQALSAFLDDCAVDRNCAFRSDGDPWGAFDALMADIEAAPLDTGSDRTLGPGEATIGVIAALYDQEYGWPALAGALDAAVAGNGTRLLRLSDGYTDRTDNGTYGSLLESNTAVNCVDTPAPTDIAAYDALAARLRDVAPRIGAASAYIGLACAFWPAPATSAPAPIRAPGAAPILVIGTTGDPATPYAWSVALADQLESGVLLTWRGEGHTATFKSPCIDAAIVAYLVDLAPPPPDTACE